MENSGQENKIAKLVEEVVEILQQDVERYLDHNEETGDVFWRRGLVRAVFAYIEGLYRRPDFNVEAEGAINSQGATNKVSRRNYKAYQGGRLRDVSS